MAATQNAQKKQQQQQQQQEKPAATTAPPAEKKVPAADKKEKEKEKEKAAPAPSPAPAPPAPAPASPPAEEATNAENPLADFATTLKILTVQFKALQTSYMRIEKELQKKQNQSNQKKQNRGDNSKKGVTPPGFMKPVKLSKELGAMLGKPEGATMPRNEVNNAIHAYIRDNNLQKEDDRRDIVPDAKLMALFKPGTYNPDEIDPKTGKKRKLTHFVLQGLIKHHFIKIDEPADDAAAPQQQQQQQKK